MKLNSYKDYFALFSKLGKLGLLFQEESFQEKTIIFVEYKKITGDIILGTSILSKHEEVKAYFLSKDLSLKSVSLFDLSTVRRAKIHLSLTTVLDYEFATFWFNAKEYRELRQLFRMEKFSKELFISRVLDILPYLK